MDDIEFSVDDSLRPTIERKLTGTTQGDEEISRLPLPNGALRIRLAIIFLRGYRRIMPRFFRNRCVFEPSCSHYSELAFREKGFWRGAMLTYKRLRRCRPAAGGVDYSFLEKENQ